jgi:mRNA-degrading endonuclease RelE of RelBE toxin-antitoxin system
MSYKVKTLAYFEKQAKRLVKKFPSLKNEFIRLIELLKENPEQGTPLGNNCYKIRLAISSKGKGKSGGGRIITNVVVKETIVYLVAVYDKSEIPNISKSELDELLKQIE